MMSAYFVICVFVIGYCFGNSAHRNWAYEEEEDIYLRISQSISVGILWPIALLIVLIERIRDFYFCRFPK